AGRGIVFRRMKTAASAPVSGCPYESSDRSWAAAAHQSDFVNFAGGGIAPDSQPCTAAVRVLPMLQTVIHAGRPQVHRREIAGIRLGQRFVKRELLEFARTAERTYEPAHWRTGNGPPP